MSKRFIYTRTYVKYLGGTSPGLLISPLCHVTIDIYKNTASLRRPRLKVAVDRHKDMCSKTKLNHRKGPDLM